MFFCTEGPVRHVANTFAAPSRPGFRLQRHRSTPLRKELPMKINLSINYENYVRQLVKLAAFTFLATPVFAQTYTVTDLGTLGGNRNGSYSVAYCINGSGNLAGAPSARSSQLRALAALDSNGQLTNRVTL